MKSITLLSFFLLFGLNLRANEVKIMTYNIRLDHPVDGVNQWPLRKDKLFQLIVNEAPDVLCIQEGLPHQVKELKKGLVNYVFVGVGRENGKNKGEYSAIFLLKTKFKIVSQNTFWLSPTPTIPGSKGWDAAITRICTYAEVLYGPEKKRFFIFNTHFDHMGEVARQESSKLILAQMASICKGAPILFTGDFNAEPYSKALETLLASNYPKFTDNHVDSEAYPNCTFTGFEVNSGTCKRIDYVLSDMNFIPTSYKIISTNNGKYYPSDHLPVVAVLELKF